MLELGGLSASGYWMPDTQFPLKWVGDLLVGTFLKTRPGMREARGNPKAGKSLLP